MLTLNLPAFEAKLRQNGGKLSIWDPVRRKYLALTPEEWVRQHFINYLIEYKQVPPSLISLEYGQQYNTRSKRCDVVVWEREGQPWLLLECKAPHVPISQDTLLQLSTYDTGLQARVLAMSNGLEHVYMIRQEGGFIRLADLPEYGL